MSRINRIILLYIGSYQFIVCVLVCLYTTGLVLIMIPDSDFRFENYVIRGFTLCSIEL